MMIFGPRSWASDGRGDLRVAEQHDRLERLAFVGGQPVDDERLAVADTVLLVSELDDRVIHVSECQSVETRARCARGPRKCSG